MYKAQDFKLNRFGAVKILKQEFSIKAYFVSKFRIEVQESCIRISSMSMMRERKAASIIS